MSKKQNAGEKDSDWKKIGPCLYRYRGANYYALVKHGGRQIRSSLDTTDLALARRRLADFRRDLVKRDPELGRRTIDDHAKKFLASLTGAESTKKNQHRDIELLLSDWPKDAPRLMTKIKVTHCKEWLQNYADLAPSTQNSRITTTRSFFALAVEAGVIAQNPMDSVTYRKRPKLIRITPTEEQFRSIVADLRRQRNNGHGADDSADFVELAGTLGLGQAELSGICRQHIDLEAGVIRVFRKKTQQQFTIPIFPDAKPIIERRLSAMGLEPEARLLPQDDCKKGLAAACSRLGLPNFEPRSLRRFHITRCLRAGIDAPTVASWQGHQDGGALILRTYQAEVGMSHSLAMAEKLKGAA
jgi:integrase